MNSYRRLAIYTAALALRLLLSPFFGHSWDTYVWLKSGELFNKGVNIYEIKSLTEFPWGFYTYPPIWLYWLAFADYVNQFIGSLNFQLLLIKLPIIIADIIVAVLISRLAAEMGLVKHSGTAALLWLFNPLVILISSVWGMFDSIAVALCLLGVLAVLRSRLLIAGLTLGLGAAVKIYPALVLVPAIVYITFVQKRNLFAPVKLVAGAIASFTTSSLPYLNNPLPMIDKLLYHFGNIGSFTYWTILSVFSPPIVIPVFSYGVFAVLLYFALKRGMQANAGFPHLVHITLMAFLATSAKVNVQYILWVLPFMLLYALDRRDREFRLNSLVLFLAGLLFILSAQITLAVFDLKNIGRIVLAREVEAATFGGVLLIFSATLGGSRLITIFINLITGGRRYVWNVQRITLISIFLMFALVISLFPAGQGIVVPKTDVRVGVVEGVESLFNKSENYDFRNYLEKFNFSYIVIPMGPEAVLYGGDYAKSFRFRLTNDQWTDRDMNQLTQALASANIKPLLGLFLKTYYISIHYGYQGFNSTRMIEEYSECVASDGSIFFECKVNGIFFEELFAEKAVETALKTGFKGFYLMGVNWGGEKRFVESVVHFLEVLKEKSRPYGLQVFVEFDPAAAKNPEQFIKDNMKVFMHADYVIIITNPFLRTVKEQFFGNYTLSEFRKILTDAVSLSKTGKAKVLFTVHVMDIAEGWMTPAIQLQTEVNEFSKVDGVAGYAVYHVSRYVPVKFSVK